MMANSLSKILCVTVMMLGAVSVSAVWFTTNTTLDAGDTTYDNQDIIVSNSTLTVNGPHGFNSLQVLGGGVVTHSPATTNQIYALQLTIANRLTIDKSSKIDVTGKGYLANRTVGNVTDGAAQATDFRSTPGGSYGGLGGVPSGSTGKVYGDYRNPNELGSGSANWGAGGGLVRISADGIMLDGSIIADGQAYGGDMGSSAGSGGGIRIDTVTLAGDGIMTANGGVGRSAWPSGGGGGGGRVAIYYDELDAQKPFNLAIHVTAHGGTGQNHGSPGTVYLKSKSGAGLLRIDSHGTMVGSWTPLGVSSDAQFEVDQLLVSGAGVVVAPEHEMPVQAGTVSLLLGATLTHLAATDQWTYSLRMTVAGALVVDSASKIDVTAKGYLAGRTLGNVTNGAAQSTDYRSTAGGSYGGQGGVLSANGFSNKVYGDYRDPNELGSGSATAGAGGGLIRISAATAQIEGQIVAGGGDRFPNESQGSAGSGGGILLRVETLGGSGTIAANGGAGATGYPFGGGGGGGRVAVYYDQLEAQKPFHLETNVTAHAGTGAYPGSVGTVYLKPKAGAGQLRVDSHGTTTGSWTPLGLAEDREFLADHLILSGAGVVAAPEHEMPLQANQVSLFNGAVLTHLAATESQTFSLRLTVTNALTIDATSQIDGSAKGYLPGRTLGNTTNGASIGRVWDASAGGSYGGRGGDLGGTPNAVYGDPRNPNELGSGGAYSGAGGGLLRISAGSAWVDGAIMANGQSVGGWGNYPMAAGSGGGILLNVGTLSGSGKVTVNGGTGNSGWPSGGGGGGGRVAIYLRGELAFPQANVRAAGGAGAATGQDGSIYIGRQPLFIFPEPQTPWWHGLESLSWIGLGIDPTGVTHEVRAFREGQAETLAVGPTPAGSCDWDTPRMPDGQYEVRALFRDANAAILGQADRLVIINNTAVWHCGVIRSSETWSSGRLHLVEGEATVAGQATVTLEPGAVVKFVPGAMVTVQSGGVFNASGTANQPVVLTSLADDTAGGDSNLDGDKSRPQPGSWGGIRAAPGATFSVNEHTDLRYMSVAHGGALAANETWLGTHMHQITDDVVVPSGTTLTIQPGAVVKLGMDKSILVQSGGQLVAAGSVALPISFTSIRDDSAGGDTNNDGDDTQPQAGDWHWIMLDGGKAEFSHCRISYGGGPSAGGWGPSGGPGKASIKIQGNASLIFNNGVIENSFYDGILCSGGPVSVASSVFTGIDRALCAQSGSVVAVVNSTFHQNRVGLLIHGGAMNATNVIVANSTTAGVLRDYGADAFTMASSDVWNPNAASGNYSGTADQTGNNGNISVDPQFKHAELGNFRLDFGSPCLDAANGLAAPATDAMGAPRYDDPRAPNTGARTGNNAYADMGAFEFVETAQSDLDLIACDITGPARSVAGEMAAITWKIRNIGSGSVTGAWHNAILLVPESSGDTVDPVPADELISHATLGANQEVSFSAKVRIPGATEGRWRWAVRANSRGDIFEGINWTNNLGVSTASTETVVPELAVGGSATTKALQLTGDSYWFKVSPKPGQDVLVTVKPGTPDSVVEVYSSNGHVPDRVNYQTMQAAVGGRSASILASSASAQAVYIMILGRSVPGGGEMISIEARSLDFSLNNIASKSQVGNQGPTTFRVLGGKLRDGLVYQLFSAADESIPAQAVYIVNSSEAYLTFDLTGKAPGSYSLAAVESGHQVILPNAVTVQTGKPGRIEVSASSPANIRPYRQGSVVITYRNAGDSDAPAPLMVLDALNATLGSPTSQYYAGNHMLLLGISQEGPAGVLPPGGGGTLTVGFESQTGAECVFDVRLVESPKEPMIWGDLKTGMRPDFIDPAAWDIVWNNILSEAGVTVGEFNALLANRATTLSRMGVRMHEVRNLLAYIGRQADQFGAISRRFITGGYGRGWADTTDIALETDTGGRIIMKVAGQTVRAFSVYGKYYIPLPGDKGVLTKNADHFEIREAGGGTLVFLPDGHIDYIEDVHRQRLTFGYSQSRLTRLTTPNGDVVKIDYNDQGRVSQVTDPVGRVTAYEYDGMDYLKRITAFDGTITAYTYNTAAGARQHSLASVVLPDGQQCFLSYDDRGALTKLSRGNGAEPITFSSNGMGGANLGYADGGSLSFAWDQYGRLRKLIDPAGNVTQFMLDDAGNWSEAISAEGNRVTMEYDYAANQTAHINATGQRLAVGFDSSSSLPRTFRGARGNETQFGYDTNNNLQTIVYPNGNTEDYTYDHLSRVTQFHNARGQVSRYFYDVRGLILAKEYPNGDKINYLYDARRNPVRVTQSIGGNTRETRYEYNDQDRMTQVIYPGGRSLSFVYDVAGRRTQLTSSDGFTQKNTYDAHGRLASVTDGNGDATVSYVYDAVGHLSHKQLKNGVVTSLEYDSQDQLVRLINRIGDTIISRFDYSYDAMGRKTRSVGPAGTNDYAYDAMGQLTGMTSSAGKRLEYAYDPDGNRLSSVDDAQSTAYTADSLDQITAAGSRKYRWDADGNLASKTDGVNQWSYEYDPENRLTKAVTPQGVFEYEYDAAGAVSSVVKDGKRTEYLLDPTDSGKVVAEIGSGSPVFYVHGIGLVGRYEGAPGESQFYTFDGNGNTSELVDSQGQVLNSYSYLPYGEVQSETGGTANPYRFGGQFGFPDHGSGLVQTGTRQYDPELGRYITRDPAYIPIGNAYLYAANDPINYVDRSGEAPEGANAAQGKLVPESVSGPVKYVKFANTIASKVTSVYEGYQRAPLIGQLKNSMVFNNGAQRAAMTTAISQNTATFAKPLQYMKMAGNVLSVVSTGINAANAYRTYQDYRNGRADSDKLIHDIGITLGGPLVGFPATLMEEGSKRSGWIFEKYYGESFRQEELMAARLKVRRAGSKTRIVNSIDPNDITGPSGYGAQSYIMVDMTMDYLIRYENKSNALASAQMVFVTNQLAKTLDYSTFELGNMGFGTNTVVVPPGRRNYTTRVDATRTLGLLVNINAEFDPTNGMVLWTFMSVDPVTGELPEDPIAGFLPPNTNAPVGEGWVRYRIRPKTNDLDGSMIPAMASIVFDTNPRIDTPAITNAADGMTPASQVNPLPPTSPRTFTVSWTGLDGLGAGVAYYCLLASTNQGPYGVWLSNTTNTSAAFTGAPGDTYAFYSLATDGVGYGEEPPAGPDAFTRVEDRVLAISYLPPSSVRISWPTSMDHHVLQSISGMDASLNWHTVSNLPSVVGDRFVLTLRALDEARYFRLYSLPQLSIQKTNGVLLLSWPKSATDFRLQSSGDLLPAIQWQPLSDVPLTNNDRNILFIPPANPRRYYRLVSP